MNGSPINRKSYYVPVLRQNTAIFAVAFWAAGGVVHADEIRLVGPERRMAYFKSLEKPTAQKIRAMRLRSCPDWVAAAALLRFRKVH